MAKTKRLLVFFHETYATGYPWKRAFWTYPEQRRCVRDLLRASDQVFTSNAEYKRRLELFNAAVRPIVKIPIFSNLGEPETLRTISHRSRRLVIFGQLSTRNRLYKHHQLALEEVCRRLRIESVVDVGSGRSESLPAQLASAPVTSAGWMEEQQLSDLMADSVAGVLGYWPDIWEKSGVMAAYCAHALVPILVELEPRTMPEPAELPYLLPEALGSLADSDSTVSGVKMQQIGAAALQYYRRNQSVDRCAEVIAKVVNAS